MINDSSQPESLLSVFKCLDESTKLSLADMQSPLILGLATLYISDNQAQHPYLSSEHIVASLEAAGVAIKRTQITKAFARAGNKISRKSIDGELHYRIMTNGRRQVEPFLQLGEITVSYIQSGKPRTARKILSELLNSLSGKVRICDPYYGMRSLDALEMIPDSCNVQFLSAQTPENVARLTGAISDFRREHSNIELRQFPDPKALHDRYVLSQQNLLILGHGIKDIGNKESFVVNISSEYAGDLIDSISHKFDERWALSTSL